LVPDLHQKSNLRKTRFSHGMSARARACVVVVLLAAVFHVSSFSMSCMQEAGIRIRIDLFLRVKTFRRGHQCQGLQPAVAMADYDEFGAPMPAKKGTLLLTAGIAGIGGALLG
jgi:hypothetical protein